MMPSPGARTGDAATTWLCGFLQQPQPPPPAAVLSTWRGGGSHRLRLERAAECRGECARPRAVLL
eukprot:5387837-Prymnesium_polylepis.1